MGRGSSPVDALPSLDDDDPVLLAGLARVRQAELDIADAPTNSVSDLVIKLSSDTPIADRDPLFRLVKDAIEKDLVRNRLKGDRPRRQWHRVARELIDETAIGKISDAALLGSVQLAIDLLMWPDTGPKKRILDHDFMSRTLFLVRNHLQQDA
jgi:hypothetical protein